MYSIFCDLSARNDPAQTIAFLAILEGVAPPEGAQQSLAADPAGRVTLASSDESPPLDLDLVVGPADRREVDRFNGRNKADPISARSWIHERRGDGGIVMHATASFA